MGLDNQIIDKKKTKIDHIKWIFINGVLPEMVLPGIISLSFQFHD